MIRVVFIMSRILGNNTYAARIEEILKKSANEINMEPIILNFEVLDYSNHAHPVNKFSSLFRTSFTAHKKLAGTIKKLKPDILFFNTWELLPGFHAEIKAIPTILGHDTTTICHHELENLEGKPSLASNARVTIVRQIHRRITKEIDFFLPMTSWVKQSLIQDFSVHESKILITPPPVDVDLWKDNPEQKESGKPRLLFVGNDFKRKGGLFLLRMYEHYLAEDCSLTIVSNDKILSTLQLPPGVELIQGVTQNKPQQLINIYQRSHLLVHPTRKDWASIAIIEAAAAGLPAISTDIGGIKDLIIPGKTGMLLPFQASESEWAENILRITRSPTTREAMGRAAREHAIEFFSYATFKQNLFSALTRIQR